MKNFEHLAKPFDPFEIEEKWRHFWEKEKLFHADSSSLKPPFCMVIPPPNVTGTLHMGHALDNTLQDIMARYKRMTGFETLWVPGTDHAGIATQTVVERDLLAKYGKRRVDFSRQEFIEIVWRWKEEKEKQILLQLKKMGFSLDFSRLRFTMDEKSNLAVKTIFKKLFDDGLIYKGDYLVNWDPLLRTALADDEVEREEKDGYLYFINYELENGKDHIPIATTRPETILGDTAIAVNKNDTRYSSFIGKKAILPFSKRKIPIISDDFVDPAFGTGAVKITPAHDFNDYECAKRHALPILNIMTEDGRINANGGEFQGLTMADAREAMVEKLKKSGLLVKIEPYKIILGTSYRSKAVIEPFLSKQWFIKMEPFKKALKKVVEEKKVEIIPQHWQATYFHWIDNLRDWCISRQLWWGHRIPIWYNRDDPSQMICHIEDGAPKEALSSLEKWYQDEDVLDTWFSSSLWPFSTLGWPKETQDLEKFYPTSLLITGHDILFFWVARMIMMGSYALKEVPFHKAFIHGLIFGKSYWKKEKDGSISYLKSEEKLKYDLGEIPPKGIESKWEKMSKSKGNVINPLEMIDSYGTDAVRIALTASATQARQIDLDRRRFEEFKNFSNKVWNATRFVFMMLDGNETLSALTPEEFQEGLKEELLTLEDKWIISTLNRLIDTMHKALENFSFDELASSFYTFFWDNFCAYYLEMCKPVLASPQKNAISKNKQKLLAIILLNSTLLLHPIAPFITEEVFSLLKKRLFLDQKGKGYYSINAIKAMHAISCIASFYPISRSEDIDPSIEKAFNDFKNLLYAIRNIRAELGLPSSQKCDLYLSFEKEPNWFSSTLEQLKFLGRIENLHINKPLPKMGSHAFYSNIQIFIPMNKELIAKEKERLLKEKEKLLKKKTGLEKQSQNQEMLQKAPPEVREKLLSSLSQVSLEYEQISEKLDKLLKEESN